MSSRRRRDPDPLELISFIADHESLQLSRDEFSGVTEERLRTILRAFVSEVSGVPPKRTQIAAATVAAKAETKKPSSRIVLFTDGASRGNPGPAGAGWVIQDEGGEVLGKGGAFLGRRTNNEAEYEAVIRGLKAALEHGANEVFLRSDSELLVKQINGTYRVKDERLQALYHTAREALQRFRRFDVKHVPREQNMDADAQANQAIDGGSSVAV
jgi:ribonuclease HI